MMVEVTIMKVGILIFHICLKDKLNIHSRLFSRIIIEVYLNPNEMSGRSYFCTCPQTILLSEKENRICTLFTHR